ncbi:MAG: PfkB family carbohydrate kinase [Parcubacteria group bacterium]
MSNFIAIGDIVTDAFIRLKDAATACDINNTNCTITMRFGDKIPYESAEVIHAVGNSANAAVSASRLGLNSALLSDVGDDENGKECLASLNANGVDTSLVKTHKGKLTNNHYVLWYESDRTILVKHEQFPYKLPSFKTPKWLYLSSLGESSESYHEEIYEYLRNHPEVSLAFQPGTYQINMGKEVLKNIYERSEIFFCNIEEAEKILGIKTLGHPELLKRMYDLGPKIVVLTDGPKGSYAYNGTDILFVPPYPDPKTPLERTGAGDAFASTTVSALALGEDLQSALKWGAINAMSVVQEVGAQKGLLSRAKIEEYLTNAPKEFEIKTLT